MRRLVPAAFMFLLVSHAAGQCYDEALAPSTSTQVTFGGVFDLEGRTLIASEPLYPGTPGQAFVFEDQAGTWVETQSLQAPTADTDGFGLAIDIEGSLVAVGAPGESSLVDDGGVVHLYQRSGPAWLYAGEVRHPQPGAKDHFGWSLSMDGDRIAVGAPGRHGGYGVVSIFERVANSWVFRQDVRPDAAYVSGFGRPVQLDGDRMIVGDYVDGRAWIFENQGGTWIETAMLQPVWNQGFGAGVDLEGDRAVVGAYQALNEGRAYVYEYNGASWDKTAVLTPADGGQGKEFGVSVDLEGDAVLIGSRLGKNGSWTGGSAYLFELDSSTWNEVARVLSPLGQSTHFLGYTVRLDERVIALGAPYSEGPTTTSGLILLYERGPGGRVERLCDSNPNSTGAASSLFLRGHVSASADDLELRAHDAVPGQPLQFFYGPVSTQLPFGDGYLCVAGGFYRLPLVTIKGGGVAKLMVDVNAPPVGSGAGAWVAGSSWVLQAWYRDPAGATGFNLTDALKVTFCP